MPNPTSLAARGQRPDLYRSMRRRNQHFFEIRQRRETGHVRAAVEIVVEVPRTLRMPAPLANPRPPVELRIVVVHRVSLPSKGI